MFWKKLTKYNGNIAAYFEYETLDDNEEKFALFMFYNNQYSRVIVNREQLNELTTQLKNIAKNIEGFEITDIEHSDQANNTLKNQFVSTDLNVSDDVSEVKTRNYF